MTKQLLSLQTLTRSIIFLVITLLMPTTLWAEDTYTYGSGIYLSLYENQYNSEWFDYGWNISITGDNPASTSDGFSDFEELRLTFTEPLKGELKNISLSAKVGKSSNVDIKVYKLGTPESNTRTQVGTIEISTGETVTYIFNASSSESCVFNNEYIQLVFEKKDPNETTFISANEIDGIELEFNGKAFGIKVDGKRVTSNNQNDILGDGNGETGSVSFDGDKTLILNNANLTKGIRTTINDLKIRIIGRNTINTTDSATIKSWLETNDSQLTFCTSDPSSTITLVPQPNGKAIDGFKVEFEDDLTAVGDYNSYGENITIEKGYDIWIDSSRFSASRRDGGYSGEISYDDNTHTLSLGGISYLSTIKTRLPQLNIKLKNNNSLSKITFESENASDVNGTLIFEKDGDTSETNNLTINEISGFKNVIYRNGLGKKINDASQQSGAGGDISYIIEPMTAPKIAYEDNGIRLVTEYEGDIVYSYDHVNEEIPDIETSKYDNRLISLVPGTLTAYIQNSDDNVSPMLKGKYFEFASSLNTTYDGQERILEESDLPELLPKVEGLEYSISYPEINSIIGSTVVSDVTKLTVCGLGKALIEAYIMPEDSYDFEVLNKNDDGRIELEVNVTPSVPTFSLDEGTYDEPKTLELSAPYKKSETDEQTTVNIKYFLDGDSDNPVLYNNPISINKSTTITAWVEVEEKPATGGDPVTHESEKVTKEYTIKQEPNIAFMQESNGEFVDIEDGTTIISTFGYVAPKIIISGTSDLQGSLVFTSSKENVVASSSISTSLNEEQEITLLNYTIKGVGETNITAQYTPANDEPLLSKTISFGLKVNPRNISDATITLNNANFTYTGSPIEPKTTVAFVATETASAATLTKNSDYNINYIQINGESESSLDTAPTNVGSYKVAVEGIGNYTGTTTKTFTITPAAMTVTASGYEGAYDGKAHGITVAAPEGATVMYGTKKGNYTQDTSPTYTDAGTHMVHYQVTKSNYTTVIDSAKVEISKADITPTVSLTGWTYGATANEPSITGNTGNGEVTYSYKPEGTETFVETKPVVVGTHTVKATIAETTNYNGAEATNTFTISPATMTVTASGYEGAYDGKAHGITVAAPEGATVMYGTQEGTYDLTASPTFTDAGTYQVYYQVSKENYTPVTGSKTVEISKAAGGLAYSAATASAELNGDGWTAPSLSNPHGLDITYSSSNTAVATVSATGAVSLTGIGQTTIKAASTGNKNYAASEAQYVLTVTRGKAKSYGVKIGDTEVNEDNYTDIFGDDGTDDGDHKRVAPSMLFNPEKNTLLIIGSNEGLTIESTLPELNIHLSQDNKLKKVVFNNQGNSANTGKVLFTCDSNFPGKLTIENTEGESAISGFASVGYEFGLQVLAPEDATYKDGKMVNGNGAVVSTLTIGVVLNPLTGDEPDELNPDDFTVTYPDGTTATIDLTNNAINNILYTLNNDTEGQGYDPEYNDIGIVTTMTDEVVTQVANDVANSTLIVGSDDYANRFIGLTFIVQGGEGTIKIAQEVEDGYEFHLKIGNNDAVKVADYIITQPNADVPYQLDDATLCWLYLVKKPGASTRMRSTRVNKRSKLMGSIKHVNIKAKTVASTNSATKVSGGIITVAANNALTDIEDTQVDNQSQSSQHNKWYTLDGRQINKPSQKGLYINNKKKIVIK